MLNTCWQNEHELPGHDGFDRQLLSDLKEMRWSKSPGIGIITTQIVVFFYSNVPPIFNIGADGMHIHSMCFASNYGN